MGIGLVFFPQFLVKGVAGVDVNPTIIGMLRGSYTLFLILDILSLTSQSPPCISVFPQQKYFQASKWFQFNPSVSTPGSSLKMILLPCTWSE